jgi:hypothetical protein
MDMSTQKSRQISDLNVILKEDLKAVEFAVTAHEPSSSTMCISVQRLSHRSNERFILLPWNLAGKLTYIPRIIVFRIYSDFVVIHNLDNSISSLRVAKSSTVTPENLKAYLSASSTCSFDNTSKVFIAEAEGSVQNMLGDNRLLLYSPILASHLFGSSKTAALLRSAVYIDIQRRKPMLVSLVQSLMKFRIIPLVYCMKQESLPLNTASEPSGFRRRRNTVHVNLETEIYEVSLVPHEEYGMGLNLDSIRSEDGTSALRVIGFKSHPITQEPLPAEATGHISIDDALLAINGTSLKGLSLAAAISNIRTVISTNVINVVTLQLQGKRAVRSEFSENESCSEIFLEPGAVDNLLIEISEIPSGSWTALESYTIEVRF